MESAREKYPYEKFFLIDLLEWDIDEMFDYVFCSGALSTRLSSDNYKFVSSMVGKMWKISRAGVSFNFLVEGYLENNDSEIFRYEINRILCSGAIKDGHLDYMTDGDEAHFYLFRNNQ